MKEEGDSYLSTRHNTLSHTMAPDATAPGATGPGADAAGSKPVVCFLGPVSSYTHQVRMCAP